MLRTSSPFCTQLLLHKLRESVPIAGNNLATAGEESRVEKTKQTEPKQIVPATTTSAIAEPRILLEHHHNIATTILFIDVFLETTVHQRNYVNDNINF